MSKLINKYTLYVDSYEPIRVYDNEGVSYVPVIKGGLPDNETVIEYFTKEDCLDEFYKEYPNGYIELDIYYKDSDILIGNCVVRPDFEKSIIELGSIKDE